MALCSVLLDFGYGNSIRYPATTIGVTPIESFTDGTMKVLDVERQIPLTSPPSSEPFIQGLIYQFREPNGATLFKTIPATATAVYAGIAAMFPVPPDSPLLIDALVDATVVGDDLIVEHLDGTLTNAGNVRGPAGGVTSVATRTGAVTLTSADVGLKNVKNTDVAALPYFVYGNSYAVVPGFACTAGQEYPTRSAVALGGGAVTSYGVSSTRVCDVVAGLSKGVANIGSYAQILAALWPGTSTRTGVVILDSIVNDVGHYPAMNVSPAVPAAIPANSKYVDGITGCYRAALALMSSESRVEQTTATFTGTWLGTAAGYTPSSGGTMAYATAVGATATYTVTPAQVGPLAGVVHALGFKLDSASGVMARIGISIDGGAIIYYTPTAWELYVGPGGANVASIVDAFAILLPIDGASHTVALSHAGSAGQFLYTDCIVVPSTAPNPVMVMGAKTVKVATGVLDATGVAVWKRNLVRLEPLIQNVVWEFPNAVWVSSTMTDNGLRSNDGIHPNDRGMQQRENDLNFALRQILPQFVSRGLSNQPNADFAIN